MANTEKKFDQYFKEKLVSHEIVPSKLAWEKFSQELDKKQKGTKSYPYMQWAAAIVLLLGSGIVFWTILNSSDLPEETLISVNQTPALIEEEIKVTEEREFPALKMESENQELPKLADNSSNKEALQKEAPILGKEKSQDPGQQEHTAWTPREIQPIDLPVIRELELPNLNLDRPLAFENNISQDASIKIPDEEPSYRVIIKSKGIKESTDKPNLIEELENKVEKIGGFLGKIEQGFAELQDAKENLFASNSPRKERSR